MNIRVTTGGIIEKDGKFLLVQENKEKCKGKWNIPAGGLKADENVLECVKRELFEETGCKVEITGLIEILNGVYEGMGRSGCRIGDIRGEEYLLRGINYRTIGTSDEDALAGTILSETRGMVKGER